MNPFFKELTKSFKWVLIALSIIVFIATAWIGCSWVLGWAIDHFFDLRNFSPSDFISFGSCVLIFTLLIQIITVILTGWAMLAYGRSRGIIKGKSQSK
jgi:ABC-type multidrug transport system fused ATPase/permease subunit